MTTDWEALYQTGETQWDKGAPAPALLEYLAHTPLIGRVLVPGCGRGHDVRAIAAAGADEVIGLDLAPSAFAGVETLPNTHFVVGDLFNLPLDFTAAFDAVYEHTCFCAIPRECRDDYVHAVAGALKPGGRLLAIFYLNPRDDSEQTADVTGHLSGTTLTVEFKLSFGDREFTTKFSGELGAETWSGDATSVRGGGENVSPFSAARKPKQEAAR